MDEEDAAKKKAQEEEEDAKNRENDRKNDEAARLKAAQEKEAQEQAAQARAALLSKYNYTFQPAASSHEQIKDAQEKLQQAQAQAQQDRSWREWCLGEKRSAAIAAAHALVQAQADLIKQKEAWEIKVEQDILAGLADNKQPDNDQSKQSQQPHNPPCVQSNTPTAGEQPQQNAQSQSEPTQPVTDTAQAADMVHDGQQAAGGGSGPGGNGNPGTGEGPPHHDDDKKNKQAQTSSTSLVSVAAQFPGGKAPQETSVQKNMQSFTQTSERSVADMKMRALQGTKHAQQRQIDYMVATHQITTDQAIWLYQELNRKEKEKNEAKAQKQEAVKQAKTEKSAVIQAAYAKIQKSRAEKQHEIALQTAARERERVEKKFDRIEAKLEQKGIARQDHLLPTQGRSIVFLPTKDGKFLRNEQGNYLSADGRTWKWDKQHNRWHVENRQGIIIIAPAEAAIALHIQTVAGSAIDTLLQSYAPTGGSPESGHTGPVNQHGVRIRQREQALQRSKHELATQHLQPFRAIINSDTRGYLLSENLNHTAFDSSKPITSFQAYLQQEIVGIIQTSANIAHSHSRQSIMHQLAHHTCALALAAQELNQAAHLTEAVALTDLTHFFQLYGQCMLEDELEARAWQDIALGIHDGATKAAQAWIEFTGNLCTNPAETVGKIADDLRHVGTGLGQMVQVLQERMPGALAQEAVDHFLEPGYEPKHTPAKDLQAVQNGLLTAVQSAQTVITNMMNNSVRQNVAGVTEATINHVITTKIADNLLQISQLVGQEIMQSADILAKNATRAQQIFNASNTITVEAAHDAAVAIAAGAEQSTWYTPAQVGPFFACAKDNFLRGDKEKTGQSGGKGPHQDQQKEQQSVQKERKTSEWNQETIAFYQHVRNHAANKAEVDGFGNFYQNKETGLWWSKDKAKHSGPHYKLHADLNTKLM